MRGLSWWWLAIPVLGAGELAAQFWAARRAPRESEWREVASEVRRAKAPEAVVVVAPAWAEPLARAAFGDAVMPLRDVARPGLDGYRRALEVSLLGQHDRELSGWQVTEERRVGRFTLRQLDNPVPPHVQIDFVDRLKDARVWETVGENSQPCPWVHARVSNGGLGGHPTYPAQRFACPSSEPYLVGATVIDDQDFRPRRCIHAHPTPRGPLRIAFDDVPLGPELRGHAGLPWLLVRDGGGAPVRLQIRVNGKVIGTHVQRDEMGWAGFHFETGVSAGTRGTVEFQVDSDSVQNRHFCFAADSR